MQLPNRTESITYRTPRDELSRTKRMEAVIRLRRCIGAALEKSLTDRAILYYCHQAQ